ncbi:hypothetical protein [Streptomyces sp. NPDC060194]|uniref:hypothetical protein n=1 Tax=Streptomyces sp. NPDC060194 TaxID=3347069 RepID=UPI003657EEBA
MSPMLTESLARGSTDDPADWAVIGAILALYLLMGFGLEYRSKKRKGAARPAKDAVDGLFSEREGFDPGQYFAGRMVMLAGAFATGLATLLTRSAPAAVQIPVVGAVALLAVFAWAYFDHRTEPRGDDGT